jgi:NitT/TauT family transport system substrate-binding protein
MFLNVLLARHQVPTDAVSVTTIGAGPTAIAAMERGMVAAGWLADPSFTLVHSRNPGVRVLADLRNEAGTLAAFGTSTYPGAVLYANAAWLDSHRTVAAGLAGAIVRTLEWMHAHSATEIAARTPRALRGEDDALFIQSLQNSMTMFSTDGVMHREGAEAVRELLAGSIDKVRAANVDLAKTYTNDFVESRKSGTGSRMSPER